METSGFISPDEADDLPNKKFKYQIDDVLDQIHFRSPDALADILLKYVDCDFELFFPHFSVTSTFQTDSNIFECCSPTNFDGIIGIVQALEHARATFYDAVERTKTDHDFMEKQYYDRLTSYTPPLESDSDCGTLVTFHERLRIIDDAHKKSSTALLNAVTVNFYRLVCYLKRLEDATERITTVSRRPDHQFIRLSPGAMHSLNQLNHIFDIVSYVLDGMPKICMREAREIMRRRPHWGKRIRIHSTRPWSRALWTTNSNEHSLEPHLAPAIVRCKFSVDS